MGDAMVERRTVRNHDGLEEGLEETVEELGHEKGNRHVSLLVEFTIHCAPESKGRDAAT